MRTNADGGKFKRQVYDRSLLDSSVMGPLSIKLAKSWRNPECRGENRRECVKHSPRIGALISTAGKVSEVPPLSLYRALLTKNRKLLGWLPRPLTRATAHVHDVHPCFHVPKSSRFIYHRFDVSTPFGYRSRKTHLEFLLHSVPMRLPGSHPRRSRYRGISQNKEKKKRVDPRAHVAHSLPYL